MQAKERVQAFWHAPRPHRRAHPLFRATTRVLVRTVPRARVLVRTPVRGDAIHAAAWRIAIRRRRTAAQYDESMHRVRTNAEA